MIKKMLRGATILGAVIFLPLMLSACNDPPQDATPPAKPPVVEHLTGKAVLRNPKQNNGETLRVYKSDDRGIVREIEISYEDGKLGWVKNNQNGLPTSLKVKMVNRTSAEAALASDGKTVTTVRYFAFNGNLKAEFADDKIQVFQADGKTVRVAMEKTGPSTETWKIYSDDGSRIVSEESLENSSRVALKLYDANGKIQYDEVRTGITYGYAQTQNYKGTVYNDQGVATHTVTIQQNYYDNGGYVQSFDELNPDGTVKSTTAVSRWYGQKYQIGIYASQDAVSDARRQSSDTIADIRRDGAAVQSALTDLLLQ